MRHVTLLFSLFADVLAVAGGWLALGCMLAGTHATAQAQPLGRPFIANFAQRQTSGSPQNWALTQSRRGLIFAANTEGLLSFNGVNWRLLSDNRKLILRSIDTFAVDGRVYVGGYNEFGYLEQQPDGTTRIHDVCSLLPEHQKRFGTIWYTFSTSNTVHFIADNAIFSYQTDGKLKTFTSDATIRSAHRLTKDSILVQIAGRGLFLLSDTGPIPLNTQKVVGTAADWVRGNSFAVEFSSLDFSSETLFLVLPLPEGLLLGTRSRGLELLQNGRLFTLGHLPLQTFLRRAGVAAGKVLRDGRVAIGTATDGVVLWHPGTNELQHVNEAAGLLDNSINDILEDREGNLWLATSSGISKVAAMQSLSHFNRNDGLLGGVLTVSAFKKNLYVGTQKGLFLLRSANTYATPGPPLRFEQVRGVSYECRSLVVIGDNLLAGTEFGIFNVQGDAVTPITGQSISVGCLYPSPRDPDVVWVGQENDGLARLRRVGGRFLFEQLAVGGKQDFTSLMETPNGDLWAYAPNVGVLHFHPSGTNKPAYFQEDAVSVFTYDSSRGVLPAGTGNFALIAGKLYLVKPDEVLVYHSTGDRFERELELFKGTGRAINPVGLFAQAPDGSIWFRDAENNKIYYTNPVSPGRTPETTYSDLLALPKDHYQGIYWDENATWLMGEEGLYRFANRQTKRHESSHFETLLVAVKTLSDSILYRGLAYTEKDSVADISLQLPSDLTALRFEFAAPTYTALQQVSYQTRLLGFEERWSAWGSSPVKEYTYLPPGDYTFQVQAKNVFGVQSVPASYHFSIRAPWYNRLWARLMFTAIVFAFVVLGIRLRSRQLQLRNAQLQFMVEERTQELAKSNQALGASINQLSQKERQLSEAYENLRQTQDQLIRNEKLSAMGNLVANFAHEINTPIGAVKGTANHLQYVLRELLNDFPPLVVQLDQEARLLFQDFIRQAQNIEAVDYSTREERKLRSMLMADLEKAGVPEPDRMAQLLPKAGFWKYTPTLDPLLQHPQAIQIVEVALHLLLLKMGLDNITSATERTRKIISTLKTFMPGHAERVEHAPKSVSDSLQAAFREFDRQFRSGIELKTTLDRTLRVRVSAEDLAQLWGQLLHNAIHAIGIRGTLTVELRNDSGFAAVTFSDTGEGIPPDILDHIFEPFFTTRKGGQGSGLGLYLCSRIVEKYGGSISASSSENGAMFTVRLPLAEEFL